MGFEQKKKMGVESNEQKKMGFEQQKKDGF